MTGTRSSPANDVLLIVENDLAFARFLLDTSREQGFKGIVTSQGVAALGARGQVQAGRRSPSTCSCPISMAGGSCIG